MTRFPFPRRALLGAAAGLAALPARAQPAWQASRPLRIVVGAAPGGSTDIVARFLAERLGTQIGQPVIVDNKAGASGAVAGEFVTSLPADGHALMLATGGTHAINPALQPTNAFVPTRDAVGVASIGTVNHICVVNPRLPVTSIAELIAYAKANPGKINYGSAGVGGPIHLVAELFKMRTGTDMVHVPYRGSGPLVADLIAGTIQLAFDNLPSSIGAVQNGQLRALAVTSAERWPTAPQLPTMAEAGVPDFVVTSWFGLTARSGTPQPMIAALNAAVNKALEGDEAAERMGRLGALTLRMTPAEFDRFIAGEQTRWREVIVAGGIKPE